jgi:hypothetical protein
VNQHKKREQPQVANVTLKAKRRRRHIVCSPPPPISGGTLLVLADGRTAVASDPDRDAVYVVDVPSASLTYTLSFEPPGFDHAPAKPGTRRHDEPGRLVEDGLGRVHAALRCRVHAALRCRVHAALRWRAHAALRSGGALATIDPKQGVLPCEA